MGLLDFMNVLLALPPFAAILLLSIVVSAVTTIVYKYTTDQKLLKQMKEETKAAQAEIKATKEPGRAAQLQKEMMKKTMMQFSASTKSMLITLIPLFLIFGWMQGHLASNQLLPGEEFTTTAHFSSGTEGTVTLSAEGLDTLSNATQAISNSKAEWRLKGAEEGSYLLQYSFGSEQHGLPVLITNEFRYEKPVLGKPGFLSFGGKTLQKESRIERITVNLRPLHPLGNFTLFGWTPGWLATYIILSLASSMLLRKLLNVY